MCNQTWYESILEENEHHARYANYFKVGHNAFEFILDFGQSYTENKEVKYFTRIITNPEALKDFFNILQESIAQYEKGHGTIVIHGHDS